MPERTEGKPIPSPDDTLVTALSLAKIGWPVFPVSLIPVTRADGTKATDKRPLVKWLEGATTDLEQIATWWGAQFPGAWVGVHAERAGIVVVDIDAAKGDKPAGRDALEAAGIELPQTFHYPTRSGGEHHIYRAPEGRTLTIARDTPEPGVDIRAGHGLMVYYGPTLTEAPQLAAAPEWSLIESERAERAVDGDVGAWLERATGGKPRGVLKRIVKRTDFAGLAHEVMLGVVSEIVKRGAEQGARTAYETARAAYVAGRPDRERDWDNAAAGSIGQHGLPPVTFPLSKAERQALKARPPAPAAREPAALPSSGRADLMDDLALAGVVAEAFRGSLVYVDGGWREWAGTRWADVSHDHVLELVRRDQLKRSAEAFEVNNRRLYERFGRRTTAENTARLIRGILERRADEFDAHPDLLNVQNGVVDLRTGELRPHDPSLYLTKIARGEFKPGATHPDWNVALEALPDDVREWVQIRAGQAATGHPPDDKRAVFFLGDGDNGKSSVVTPLQKVLGDYARMAPERLLLASTGEMPLEIAGLRGVRLVLAEELPEDHRIRSKRLKDLLGTETLTGRQLYRDYVSFRPSHSLWITSNYPPRIAESDRGTWARIAIVRFPFTYSMRPAAGELAAKPRLRADLEAGRGGRDAAVLAWIVEGARRWYEAGMVLPQPPKRVRRDTEGLREDTDPVMGFAAERLEFAQGARVTSAEMADEFGRWLFSNGHPPWSHQLISSRLESHELFTRNAVRLDRTRIDGKQARVWLGVGLRPHEPTLKAFQAQSNR